MPLNNPAGRSDIAKIVDKQMRNWELSRAQHAAQRPASGPHGVIDFVAISRTIGSGGREVATLLGERLGWPMFDREILHAMAGDDDVRARLYEQMDERDVGWLEDTVRWLIKGELPKDDYFCRLTETVLVLARQGHAVFLGRGADLILPRDRGLRMRIIAPLEQRAQVFAQVNNVSEALARAEVERIDRQRLDFRRRHFGSHANDPTRHDLIISMAQFTVEQAVEIILTALRLREMIA